MAFFLPLFYSSYLKQWYTSFICSANDSTFALVLVYALFPKPITLVNFSFTIWNGLLSIDLFFELFYTDLACTKAHIPLSHLLMMFDLFNTDKDSFSMLGRRLFVVPRNVYGNVWMLLKHKRRHHNKLWWILIWWIWVINFNPSIGIVKG